MSLTFDKHDVQQLRDELSNLLGRLDGYRQDSQESDRLYQHLDTAYDSLTEVTNELDEAMDAFTKPYRVTFYRVIALVVDVEAVDEEDAIEQAQDREYEADVEDDDYETMWSAYDSFPPEVEEV